MRRRRAQEHFESFSRSADPLSQLRSNVELALQELERPSIMVTSSRAHEGSSATAGGLARALASAGRRVVLVDLDLRHPSLHQVFGISNEVGITDILLARKPADACLRFVPIDQNLNGDSPGLYVLPAGIVEGEPAELIGGSRTRQLLELLERQADVVIIDAPAVLDTADTLILGRRVGGALLVVESGRTSATQVEQARAELVGNQVRLIGAVLNTRPSKRR